MTPTSFQDAACILAAKFCMKPIIVEAVLRGLDENPVRAASKLSAMPFDDAMSLLFQKVWAMPLPELQAASWQ